MRKKNRREDSLEKTLLIARRGELSTKKVQGKEPKVQQRRTECELKAIRRSGVGLAK